MMKLLKEWRAELEFDIKINNFKDLHKIILYDHTILLTFLLKDFNQDKEKF